MAFNREHPPSLAGWLVKLRRRLVAARSDWLYGGSSQLSRHIVSRLQVHLLRDAVVMDANAPLTPPTTPLPEGFSLSIGSEADVHEMALCGAKDAAEIRNRDHLFRQFLAEGHCCAVAHAQGEIIGSQWMFFHRYVVTIDEYRASHIGIRLFANSAFFGNAYVRPDYRSRQIARHLKLYVTAQRPEYEHFYTWVDSTNIPSLHSNAAIGFRPMATLRFLGPIAVVRVLMRNATPESRWIGVSKDSPDLVADGHRLRIAKSD